ncbi:MAG: conjugal transfer protein TraF [Planctomycetes bacterium]|nr:conjugal transfer protein TraF [Planctomycetota bacterium]
MKNTRWIAAVVAIIMVSSLAVNAEEWSIYGPRAEGMGGAGVATADGATAHYWNPGATTKNEKSGLYITGGLVTSAEGDVVASLDKVAQKGAGIDWNTVMGKVNGGTPLTVTEAQQVIGFFSTAATELNQPGQGFLVNGSGGLSFAVGSWTVFGNGFMNMNLDPVGDDQNLAVNSGPSAITNTVGSVSLGSPANSTLASNIASQSWWIAGAGDAALQADNFVYLAEQGGADTSDPEVQQTIMIMAQNLAGGTATVQNNETGVIINGLIVSEFGASHSWDFVDVIGQTLSVGVNLKLMQGQTYYQEIKYSDLEGTDKLMNNVNSKENTKSSTAFGIDAGALVSFSDVLKGGLVIRNLNSPKFSYAGRGDAVLDPQIRAGVAMNLGMITLAADYDVTKNKSSLLKGYESQMFGLGAEVSLIGTLKLRMGTYQNMASVAPSAVMTYGLGFHLLFLDLDLAGAMASKNVKVEDSGSEIPASFGGSAAIALRF